MDLWLERKLPDGRAFKLLDLTGPHTYIIEHPTLGLFAGFGEAATSGKYGPRWKRGEKTTRRTDDIYHERDPGRALEMFTRVFALVPAAYLVKMKV